MSSAYNGSSGVHAGREGRSSTSQAISGRHAEARGAAVLTFRCYRVYPSARRITAGEREVALGGRAFDLLVALLRVRGKIVSQFEIVRQVWPSTTVDSCNLRFQMGVLRRALGPDRDVIKTIRGRGYMIVEDCEPVPAWPIDPAQLSDTGARCDQSAILTGNLDHASDRLRDFACPADFASFTRMARAPSPPDRGGLATRIGSDLPGATGAPRAMAIGEIDPADVGQRLAELEQENAWLKLAIANLTLKRMAQILPQEI